MPRVSAILVVHNQAQELRRALAALEASMEREQLEILVVDCASEDDTPAVADEFPAVITQRMPQNFGTTKALNIATRTAKGDFLFLLSPEVEVAPDTVVRLAEQLEANSDTSAVCPLLIDPEGKPVSRIQALPGRDALARACAGEPPELVKLDLSQENIVVGYPGREALLVRKQFIMGMNYFDERFGEYWADADLALKIRQAGRKIRLYPGIQAVCRRSEHATGADPLRRSDCIVGAARLVSKYDGAFSGFTFRMGAALRALFAFDFGLFSAILGGRTLGSEASKSYPV
jgi:GT2 family glycosyltransferase